MAYSPSSSRILKVSHVLPTPRSRLDVRNPSQIVGSPMSPLEEGPLTPSPGASKETTQSPLTLEKQIQNLTDMLRLQTSNADSHELRQKMVRLERENLELSTAVRQSEERLQKLQDGVTQLHEEFRIESAELQEELRKVTEAATEEKRKKLELEKEYKKLKRTKQRMDAYLKTLPSEDELKSLQRRFSAEKEENAKLSVTIGGLRTALTAEIKEKASAEAKYREIASELEDLRCNAESLKNELESEKKRRDAVQMLSEEEKEALLLEDSDRLRKENETLHKVLSGLQMKREREKKALTKQLHATRKELQTKSEQLDAKSRRLEEELSTNRFLRSDLGSAKCDLSDERRRAEALAEELSTAREASALSEVLLVQLTREQAQCALELRALASTAGKLAEGQEPSIKDLLALDPLTQDEQSEEDRSKRLKNMLETVREVRRDVGDIRESMSETYADTLGNNMVSCITQ